jgi:NADH dehydrogenase
LSPALKSLQDALTIRRTILDAFEAAENAANAEKRKALLTFVLVGGGPTGVEMAGALAELAHRALARDFRHIDPASARIVLVEGELRILPTFPASLTRKARKKLQQFGVEVRRGVQASPAGKWLGAEVDHAGRVKVRPDLSVPGHPDIFVVGDSACAIQNGKPLEGLAPVAMQEGRYVASVLAGRVTGKAHRRPFHYFDKGTLATVGRAYAVADIGPLHFTGLLAWLTWVAVHIYYLIGFRNRLLVLLQYAWAYVTYQQGARIILPEESAHPAQEGLGTLSRAAKPG